jgi:hypothetical protein
MPRLRARGNTLLVALILLAVLSAVAATAVTLSSQERTNAYAASRVEFLDACASAAQAKIWAEMSQYGMGYLGNAIAVTPMTLPDGTTIVGPAHLDSQKPDGTWPLVKDVTFKVDMAGGGGAMNERDCTNGGCGILPLGQTHGMTAVCFDREGRGHEIELSVKFAL